MFSARTNEVKISFFFFLFPEVKIFPFISQWQEKFDFLTSLRRAKKNETWKKFKGKYFINFPSESHVGYFFIFFSNASHSFQVYIKTNSQPALNWSYHKIEEKI